jgi:hypothetical protein
VHALNYLQTIRVLLEAKDDISAYTTNALNTGELDAVVSAQHPNGHNVVFVFADASIAGILTVAPKPELPSGNILLVEIASAKMLEEFMELLGGGIVNTSMYEALRRTLETQFTPDDVDNKLFHWVPPPHSHRLH